MRLLDGPDIQIQADPNQLDQLLINLIKNAAEATMENQGEVRVGWKRLKPPLHHVEVFVEDDGNGVANPVNLFVPFFTTKPEGSGLGLYLCRQIAEAHNGSLTLTNRTNGDGCIARLQIPFIGKE